MPPAAPDRLNSVFVLVTSGQSRTLGPGNARDQVLGLEVVLPDGRIWDGLRGLRKDNTGYDLKHLFVGAEGTLGVLTAAVLKLYPRPSARVTAWVALDTPTRAVELLGALRGSLGDRLSAFELMPRRCLEAVLGHFRDSTDPMREAHPWYVLTEIADGSTQPVLGAAVEAAFGACLEAGMVRDVVLAQSEAQSAALWRLRERLPEAQFSNVKHDISVPVSRIAEFIERGAAALERAFPGVAIFAFGHVGDGNLHYNIGMTDAAANAALIARGKDVNAVVYEIVDALGGSISAEHGLGQLKREEIRAHKAPLELELMRRLKDALDPQGLMNPGKVL